MRRQARAGVRCVRRPVVEARRVARAVAEVETGWKVLLVVAHPDDESYFAGAVYRLTAELGGVVDEVVITDGAGGYRYAGLAERIYGTRLAEEGAARARLPEIRRRETLAAGRILGIRRHYFLGQRDDGYTEEAGGALGGEWDCGQVRARLRELMEGEGYDFVLTMLPRAGTHGHHQAAAVLAVEAAGGVGGLSAPVVLGGEPGVGEGEVRYGGGLVETATEAAEVVMDRRRRIGGDGELDYRVLAHWVIAEHKSQGRIQCEECRHEVERYWRYSGGPADSSLRVEALRRDLEGGF